MTDRDFRKLKRLDLLQMLLEQAKETEQLGQQLDNCETELKLTVETCERLKRRLDEKDEQINKLKNRLDEKDEQINRLKGRLDKKDAQIGDLRTIIDKYRNSKKVALEDAGSIAEATLKLNGIFEAAQQAADQYLYNIKMLHEGRTMEDDGTEETDDLLRKLDAELSSETEQETSKTEEASESSQTPETQENPEAPQNPETPQTQEAQEASQDSEAPQNPEASQDSEIQETLEASQDSEIQETPPAPETSETPLTQ